MLPIIVLIGRTNVGKSTLFNVLTKTRNALVANYSGITRDRQYGYFDIEKNQKSILIDTAGLDIKLNKIIEKKAYEQALMAIKEAHLVLFIVDARSGVMPQEYEICKIIRTYEKKTILIINKIDGINHSAKINEFYSLGIRLIHKISASHNQGINTLISKYLIPWVNSKFKKEVLKILNANNTKKKLLEIKIAVIGRPNAGKSTLINSLLKKERMITCDIPGTTLDSISISVQYDNYHYVFIDTAGVSKKKKKENNFEKFSIIKTLKTIETTDVTLLIIDASIKICNQDLSLADFIIKSGRAIIVVINKSDLLSPLQKKEFQNSIKNQLKFLSFSRVHFISALYKKGIFPLFKSINESYQALKIKISTSELTKIMYIAIKKHQPPIIKGRRIKLKYAHLGSSNPPNIILHGTQLKFLSLSYKRYLINFFHNFLKIKGAPIKIQYRENTNPYALKKIKN